MGKMVIFFNVKEVREFLMECGFVYTLRKKRKRVGRDIAVYGSLYKWTEIFPVDIHQVRIRNITDSKELSPFTIFSGLFPSSWIHNIRDGMTMDEAIEMMKKEQEETANKWLILAKQMSGEELYLYKVIKAFDI